MPEPQELTEELRVGSRALDLIPELELLGDFTWIAARKVWALHCRLRADVLEGGLIPRITAWYLCVDPAYPAGAISLFPAKAGGITATFPHQEHNGEGRREDDWRSGKLCLTTDVLTLGRFGGDTEPRNDRERLSWHIQRALLWLSQASRGELQPTGTPFELPQYPCPTGRPLPRVAFSEPPDSLNIWEHRPANFGLATLAKVPGSTKTLLVTALSTLRSEPIHIPTWGRYLENAPLGPRAAWIFLDQPVVLNVWQAPTTWRELREHLQSQGVELGGLLRRLLPHLRCPGTSILLLGFPIPRNVGEAPARVHWLALELPECPPSKARRSRQEHGLYERDYRRLARNPRLCWLTTESWDEEEIGGRGLLPKLLRQKKTLLFGAGALGSVIAELLVRGGLHEMSIVDGDRLVAGNLVRHLLTLDHLDQPKASALADRLNRAAPHASVAASATYYPEVDEKLDRHIAEADLLLDCTASDEVLLHMERCPGPFSTHVVLCLGIESKRLYAFASRGVVFPRAAYTNAIGPWLEQELKEKPFDQWPREGIGCWHPVFPARVDEIWLLAAAAIQWLIEVTSRQEEVPRLTIFERILDGERLIRLERTEVSVPYGN